MFFLWFLRGLSGFSMFFSKVLVFFFLCFFLWFLRGLSGFSMFFFLRF